MNTNIFIKNVVNKNYKVLPGLFAALNENSSKTLKSDAKVAENALKTYTALANGAITVAEGFLCEALPFMLKAAASKVKPVREAACEAVQTINAKMSVNAVRQVLPALFAACKVEEKAESRVLALQTIASYGDNNAEQLGYALPQVCSCLLYMSFVLKLILLSHRLSLKFLNI